MKLAWLQDLDFMVNAGGAQLTDRAHFLEGLRRGHDIELVLPQSTGTITGPVIVSNAAGFSLKMFQEMQVQGRPYIWFAHDYWPICKLRLFYPMQDRCHSCYLKERWLPVVSGARLIIWLSPLHRESWLWLYPEIEKVRYCLVPSPVDPEMFCDLGQQRQGVLVVEGLHPFKGRRHVLQWIAEHPDIPATCVGGDPGPEPLPANCTLVGEVAYGEMNVLYNRHEALLHLPQSPSPFDRTVAEAKLAGCRVITNSLVGAMSWPWMRNGREEVARHLSESSRKFWGATEEALQ